MRPTHTLAELAPAPGGVHAQGPAVVCGRVLSWVPGDLGGDLVIDDGTGPRRFPLPLAALPAEGPTPGDFVALELPEAACVAPRAARRLAAYRGAGPFPPPEGEWYRLRRGGERRLRNLRQRARALAAARRFFEERGFLEIEAPLCVPSPGLELHLDAFAVSGGRYLVTSPEYQLKRLLCAGLPRIYSLGKVFRRGEAGPQHNPEFTMLEWYRAFAGWEDVCRDVEELCAALAIAVSGAPRISTRGVALDLTPPWPRMTVSEALWEHGRLALRGDESAAELRRALRELGHDPGGAEAWDDLFFSFFLDRVEPRLAAAPPDGPCRPTVLYDWPRPLCALAREKPGEPAVVERFEAYAAGLELCNGFGELCDPDEQRRRFERDLEERRRRGLPAYPVDERFLAALREGMPPAGGVALGVDRLLMLLLDAGDISDVLPFSAAEL